MRLRIKVWIEQDGRMVFGDGLDRLLELVEETGSIARAASRMGLAYREAWGRLRQAEQAVGQPLLSRHAGGTGGGGASLTPLARRLKAGFRGAKAGLLEEAARLEQLYLDDGAARPEKEKEEEKERSS